jgi:predicted Fe-Mo cluster-binding NifX family protein
MDGLFINLHLGESDSLRIYRPDAKRPELVDIRSIPGKEVHGISRWKELASLLKDCSFLLVHGIGPAPRSILMNAGISVYVVEGFVEKALTRIGAGKDLTFMILEEPQRFASACNEDSNSCDDDPPY